MLGDGSKACPLLGRTFKSMPGFFSKHCGGLQTLCRCPIDAVETKSKKRRRCGEKKLTVGLGLAIAQIQAGVCAELLSYFLRSENQN